MTPAYKQLRKLAFKWMKEQVAAHKADGWYYFGLDHTITIPVKRPLQVDGNYPEVTKACQKMARELLTFLTPFVKHDQILKQKLFVSYPKDVFKQTFCLGVWSDENKYPAQILTVWAAVGGPYGKIGICGEGGIDRLI